MLRFSCVLCLLHEVTLTAWLSRKLETKEPFLPHEPVAFADMSKVSCHHRRLTSRVLSLNLVPPFWQAVACLTTQELPVWIDDRIYRQGRSSGGRFFVLKVLTAQKNPAGVTKGNFTLNLFR